MTLRFFNDEWEEFMEHCGFTDEEKLDYIVYDEEKQIVPYLRRGARSVLSKR